MHNLPKKISMKNITLLIIPLLLFTSCKRSEESSVEDTTWRDKSAKEKLESMKFNSVIENASDKIDGLEDRVNSVMLMVNYDDDGNIWLTGLGAPSQKKVKTVTELSRLLSLVALKGDAGVSHVSERASGSNSELETQIMTVLRNQGFDVTEVR